ncbi:MAG: pantoate--beta-alanine ligase [Myxococcaceae bacterium]|nr:pantoate--beta-alanine ligase [Myxococcaceae bacterium]MCA3016061.1 pantoate--beta-alanine ligase [Myxococcaceae bacterium]
MTTPRLLKTPQEVRWFERDLRRRGQTLALVPTMGFLHEGHLSLMREGRARCDVVAATIFVNPTQFGPREDLSRYPRDLAGDLAKCGAASAAVVYAPEPATVYPDGYQTYVSVEQASLGLCGDRRPGHFRGVATVVAKLLALFRPDVALFGEKDYQQLKVIEALARDLELGVEVVGRPTVREADGLAMSSRNAYLSPDERERARALSKGLFAMAAAAAAGQADVAALVALGTSPLAEANVRLDYLEVRDAATLSPLTALTPGRPARALVAGFLGTTRLIDNLALQVP